MGVNYREQYKPEHLEPFFPHEIIKMIIVVLCTLALLMFLVVLPTYLENLGIHGIAHAEDPADPSVTPPHIRPEWYFLAVYQYLKLMPSEVLGIGGKALGILTQMIVVILLFLLPFWYPLQAARVKKDEWRAGLSIFALQWFAFLIPSAVLLWFRNKMPDPYRDIIHPMFVWPVLWFVVYAAVGYLMRKVRLRNAFEWLKLLNTGLILIGFQGLIFFVVLGQGLSWAVGPATGYLTGLVFFVPLTMIIIWFLVRRINGKDQTVRAKLMAGLITEGLVLFLGLTIWAMWPVGGLTAAEGAHSETRSFAYAVAVMVFALAVFYAFLITELRTVHRTLKPEERDQLV
jgi:quinol-cytochrome oxidoreductase complex cytochrome b subunit